MSLRVSVLTVFTDLCQTFIQTSIVGRAQQSGVIDISLESFFSVVAPKQRIDAPTFGHGAGMLIKPEVVQAAIEGCEQRRGRAFKIFFSPRGQHMDQHLFEQIAACAQQVGHLMLVSSRYEGIDARAEEEYADMIVSAGDFVLMSGDVPAMMLLEGVLRLIPGVVGKQESVISDSFTGAFVDHPEFTEPVVWKDMVVPEVIRSGNHRAIQEWRTHAAARASILHHFSWLRSQHLSDEERVVAWNYVPPHYVVLMHSEVIVDQDRVGTTSVTSIDIHDIARSAYTFGLKHSFIVTPLKDQQKIVRKFLDFWQVGDGVQYNKGRHEALSQMSVLDSFDQVIEYIEKKEGKKPLTIATSARDMDHKKNLGYTDQEQVWVQQRPVLFVIGTGRGLSQELIGRCDYLLLPIKGFPAFNHLSVRSATAIIVDRWLGLNETVKKVLSCNRHKTLKQELVQSSQ